MPILRNHHGKVRAREVYRDDYATMPWRFSRCNRRLLATPWWFPVGAYPIFGGCQKLMPRWAPDAMGPIWPARPPSYPPQMLDNLRDTLTGLMAS